MYKILKKEQLTPLIFSMEVEAPRIAQSAKPGQFLIVRCGEMGERVPLTICDFDREKGTVRIVIQIAGVSSNKVCSLNEGDSLTDITGPLGKPSDFMDFTPDSLKHRHYLFVAGGVGAAPVYPQAKYLHSLGAKVDVIIGARNKDLIIMEEEMKKVCTNLFICTDDGTKGEKGNVTVLMERLVNEGNKYDMCVAIGPMIMMKFATLMAKKCNLPIIVSLNTLMVDGTGMCGACRVSVGGKTMFACVDGPEFNGYDIDFDEALRRQTLYRKEEQQADAEAGLDFLVRK